MKAIKSARYNFEADVSPAQLLEVLLMKEKEHFQRLGKESTATGSTNRSPEGGAVGGASTHGESGGGTNCSSSGSNHGGRPQTIFD